METCTITNAGFTLFQLMGFLLFLFAIYVFGWTIGHKSYHKEKELTQKTEKTRVKG